MAKKEAPQTKMTPKQAREFLQRRELTQMEGDADRADGRKTRVQQRGRIRK